MNTQIDIAQISARLRSIRLSRSLSLSDVEVLSKGRLKAVVLGSYERGARTLSVKRAIEIADLYQVSLTALISDEKPVEIVVDIKTVIDLRTINRRAQNESHPDHQKYLLLARMAQRVVRSRQDWNGEVLSIRQTDLETIALLFNEAISQVLRWLDSEQILLKARQS